MRVFQSSELLGGSDHEFVVNLYTLVLNRWPDEEGYRHYLTRVEGRPEARRDAISEIADSEEAKKLGVVVQFDDAPKAPPPPPPVAPPPPGPALAPPPPPPFHMAPSPPTPPTLQLQAEIGQLHQGIAALRAAAPAAGEPADLRAVVQRIEASLRQMRAELDELQLLASSALQRQLNETVNTLVNQQAASLEQRLRALEQRVR